MQLSIVIVNWNTRDLLAQCLTSVYTHPPDGDFEIFVVDNASTDGSAQMVREQFPQVCVIENSENVGFARANNQAIYLSAGRYVLLLNSDAVMLPNTLNTLVSFADAHPQAGIVGTQWLNPDGTFQASFNDFPRLLSECLLLFNLARLIYSPYFPSYPPKQSRKSRECDWVGGACLLARTAAIEQVGLLDEGYFMYVEEADWCFRMKKHGWKIFYCAEAEVVHRGGQSADRSSAKQQVLLYRSKTLFFRKYRGCWAAHTFKLAVHTSAALKAGYWILRSLLSRRDMRVRERARAHWSVTWAREL